MGKVPKLSVIRNERERESAKEVRRSMYKHVRSMSADAGDRIAGFACVLWDKDGHNWSFFKSGGPIKSRLIPMFVRDALQQHVTLDLAEDEKK